MQARVLNSAKGNKHTNFITLAVLDFIATKRAAFSYENDQQSSKPPGFFICLIAIEHSV